MENRYAVTLNDGSTMWLPEEAYQRYVKGELDLENPQLTPEQEKVVEEAYQLMLKDLGLLDE